MITPVAQSLDAPRAITRCRICFGAHLEPCVDLGAQYLSDFPQAPDTKPFPPVPLVVVRCLAPGCGLVQLTHTTPREWLYRQYWYRSGVNETMRAELADIVQAALQLRGKLPAHATVADIGANDGTLLANYPESLIRVAWEPARNLYQVCRPHCSVLFPEFFEVRGAWAAEKIEILTSIAMFYDLDQPHPFVADVAKVLAPKGVWCVQQAYLLSMLEGGFDNIGHEHLEYYHLAPLERLLAEHGLEVFHVEPRAINGGSFRTWIGWKGARPMRESVGAFRTWESHYHHPEEVAGIWSAFAQHVEETRDLLQARLRGYQARGVTVDLLGASTKANTLLQTCGVDATQVRQAWERSPEKVGRFAGVSGIPIVDELVGRADPPRVLLAGAWQFREGLIRRESEFLAAGGEILFPLPRVETWAGVAGVGR